VREYTVAVAGATGVVGQEMIKVLAERRFPVKRLLPLASQRSVGKEVEFQGSKVKVELLTKDSFEGVDIALFSAGAGVSKEIAPQAAKSGAIVIDNSSAFRMDPEVPLVVPEVNPQDAFGHKGIIANPNCSTIQMVVVLKPVHDAFGIERVVVSTYQSVSGWGKEAVDQLWNELEEIVSEHEPIVRKEIPRVLPYQIAFNLFPHIDVFMDEDYTKEEWKMVNETRKIMHSDIRVTATCVRVPVLISHSEAVNVSVKGKSKMLPGERNTVSRSIQIFFGRRRLQNTRIAVRKNKRGIKILFALSMPFSIPRKTINQFKNHTNAREKRILDRMFPIF